MRPASPGRQQPAFGKSHVASSTALFALIVYVSGCRGSLHGNAQPTQAPVPQASTIQKETRPAPVSTIQKEAQPAPLTGFVHANGNTPISGATVALRDKESDVPEFVTHSDERGMFSITVPPGTYDLSAAHEAFLAMTQPIVISKAQMPTLDLVLREGGYLFEGRLHTRSARKLPVATFWTTSIGNASYSIEPRSDGSVKIRLPERGYLLLTQDKETMSSGLYVEAEKAFDTTAESMSFMAEPADEQIVEDLRGEVHAVENVSDVVDVLAALPKVRRRSAAVWGVGEAVHGARESIALRMMLLRSLAKQGTLTVALEANWANVLPAERYIQGERGDAATIARELRFFMWRNQETADALVRLREYNRHSGSKIHLVGIDIQSPAANWDALHQCPGVRGIASSLNWLSDEKAKPTTPQILEARRDLERLQPKTTKHWQAATRPCSAAFVGMGATVLLQYLQMLEASNFFVESHVRDRALAANVVELSRTTRAPVIVWAHNLHVARRGIDGERPMGEILAMSPDVDYVPIGMVVGQGAFNARTREDGNPLKAVELPPPGPNFLASLLGRVSSTAFLLDLSSLGKGTVQDRLARATMLWEVGAIFHGPENSAKFRLPVSDFMVLAYLPTISPATLLESP